MNELDRGDQLPAGARIGDYEVEEEIGSGAYGRVYSVIHPVIGKRAAAKVLRPRYASDERAVGRFIAEARAVNQIGHANIVDIFNFGTLDDGRCFHVMELLEGETLEALLGREGRFSWENAQKILTPISQALGAAHAQQIVHRDLKPSNVFLARNRSGERTPKLLDFGIAKLLSGEHSAVSTGSGVVIGTPYYMSPEQIRGQKIDHRTDIYSFGVLLYQMLVGTPPFVATNKADMFVQHLNHRAVHPADLEPSIPRILGDGVLAMLEKDRDQRPASMAEAMGALTRASPAAELTATVAPTNREAKQARRLRGPALALILTAVAVIVGLVIALRDEPASVNTDRPLASSPKSVTPTEVEVPSHVRVTFEGAPERAEVHTPDGRFLGRAPVIELDESDRKISVVIDAEGHEPWTYELIPNRNQTIVAEMKKRAGIKPVHSGVKSSSKKTGADDLPHWE